MFKALFYDTETTGVKYWRNGIHQISGIISVDREIKEQFDIKTRPEYPGVLIEDEALQISGVTRELVMSYQPMKTTHSQITALLGKHHDQYQKGKKCKYHLVGYNNKGFDDEFLRAFFKQCGDEYFGSWFWPDSIDVRVLAAEFFKDVRYKMPNFKLGTVCQWAGIAIDETKQHDAIYDISKTMELYYFLIDNWDKKPKDL